MSTGRPDRLRTVLAWLLTPLAAWAASFGGAWLAARLTGGLVPMLLAGALTGLAGGIAVFVMLRPPIHASTRPLDGP